MRTILILWLFVIFGNECVKGVTIQLPPDQAVVERNVTAGEWLTLEIQPGSPIPAFCLIQTHSIKTQLLISYDQTDTPAMSTRGHDVGLVVSTAEGPWPSGWIVYMKHDSNESVSVLVVSQCYSQDTPIPGGCNMEQSVRTAPFLPVTFTGSLVTVEYPLATWPLNVVPITCDRAPLQYDLYVLYLPARDLSERTAFDYLVLMNNVSFVEAFGTPVSFHGSPPSKVKFSNYPGTGRIVAVIVRSLTSSAAYVPSLTYGCDPPHESNASCDVLHSIWSKVLLACGLFVGLFLAFCGHRFYKCQVFLMAFGLTTFALFFVIVTAFALEDSVGGGIAAGIGAIGGAFALFMWMRSGIPVIPITLAGLMLGILAASTVLYSPLGDFYMFKDDTLFWLSFSLGVVIIQLIMISFNSMTSILCCAIIGAYLVAVPLDHYLGGNLKFILINIFRRGIVPSFDSAIVQPPFHNSDLIVTIVWGALALCAALFQMWRERRRAPFPSVSSWSNRQIRPPDEHTPLIAGG